MARHAPASRFQGLPWTLILWSAAGVLAIGAVTLVALDVGEAVTPPERTTAALPTPPTSYNRPVIPSIGASGAWNTSATSTSASPSTATVTVVKTITVSPRLTSPPPPRPPAAPGTRTVTETQTVTETATVTVTETVTLPPPALEEIP